MNILIVDDHATNRKLLRAQLEAEGHTILEAVDGVDALTRLEHEPTEAVISDILMPRLDGFRLCRAVRQDKRFSAVPFILYTSTYDSASDRQLAVTVGADAYVLKPAATSVLIECLRTALQRNGRGNTLQATVHEEAYVLRQYSEALVHKLEEKNSELQEALEQLRRAHDVILDLNQDLEQRVEERTAELTVAREAADLASTAKGAFLATMSHEIRTPVSGMLGMLELMSIKPLDAEQRSTLAIARESGTSLIRIIDDILDFSKIEAGKLEIALEPASIRDVVESVRAVYAWNAASKGLAINCSVDPEISPAIRVDALRLRQILNNLVSNAIKFTVKGGVEIKVEMVVRFNMNEQLRFTVRDTGIGVSAENLHRLFQPFSQGDSAAARQAGGTGLGLAICRRLAEMMGGSVEIVSELGEGTTVILNLTASIVDPSELRKSAVVIAQASTVRPVPTVRQAETDGTLVLLVDDHPTNRTLLTRQLAVLGYAAETADDGLLALDMWKSGRYGILIADCNMPLMDGYELTRRIRGLESAQGAARTPIIACTANALGGEVERCLAAGMDDCLTKPIELAGLFEKLDKWLPISKESQMPLLTVQPISPVPTAPLDRSFIAASWGEDEVTMRTILTDFRRFNDADAQMLRLAVESGDMAQVTRATHRMFGAGKMIGATDFAGTCERIELPSRLGERQKVNEEMPAFEAEWSRLKAYIDTLLPPARV